MKTTDTLVLFWRTPEIYSNWHPAKFTDGKVEFDNSEQYMMVKKAELMGDLSMAAHMLTVSDPSELKKLGRQVHNYDEALWEENRMAVMVEGCFLKFSQNPAMRDELLATGDRLIVEASPYDKVWGIGLEENDLRSLDPTQWQGRNLLGEALMQVREKLRNQ